MLIKFFIYFFTFYQWNPLLLILCHSSPYMADFILWLVANGVSVLELLAAGPLFLSTVKGK